MQNTFFNGWLECTLTNAEWFLDNTSTAPDLEKDDAEKCRSLLAELWKELRRISQDPSRGRKPKKKQPVANTSSSDEPISSRGLGADQQEPKVSSNYEPTEVNATWSDKEAAFSFQKNVADEEPDSPRSAKGDLRRGSIAQQLKATKRFQEAHSQRQLAMKPTLESDEGGTTDVATPRPRLAGFHQAKTTGASNSLEDTSMSPALDLPELQAKPTAGSSSLQDGSMSQPLSRPEPQAAADLTPSSLPETKRPLSALEILDEHHNPGQVENPSPVTSEHQAALPSLPTSATPHHNHLELPELTSSQSGHHHSKPAEHKSGHHHSNPAEHKSGKDEEPAYSSHSSGNHKSTKAAAAFQSEVASARSSGISCSISPDMYSSTAGRRHSLGSAGSAASMGSAGLQSLDPSHLAGHVEESAASRVTGNLKANMKMQLKRVATGRLDRVATDLIDKSTSKQKFSFWGSISFQQDDGQPTKWVPCVSQYAFSAIQLMSLIATLYSLVATPVAVCFSETSSSQDSLVEVICESLLLAGIAAPFLLGLANPEKKGEVLRHWGAILDIYGRGFLIVDIVASWPWHCIWLLLGKSESLSYMRILSFCRLLKLVGLMDGGSIQMLSFRNYRSSLHPNLLRAIRLIIFFFFVVHVTACGYYAVASEHSGPWTKYATEDSSRFSEWVKSYYWALCAIMGENMEPDEYSEAVYSSIVVAGGVLLNSCIVGSMATMLGTLDERAARHKSKLDTIDTFMHRNGVTKDLREQVQKYYKYLYSSVSRDAGMLTDVSPSLRLKIDLCIHSRFISNCNMFSSCSAECVATLVTIISRNWIIFSPAEVVFSKGEIGDAMYFVVKGEIVLYNPGDAYEDGEDMDEGELQRLYEGEKIVGAKLLAKCVQGGFFGELALVVEDSFRGATAAAHTFSELLNLPRHDFNSVLQLYPDFQANMREMVNARMEQNRKSAITDAEDSTGSDRVSRRVSGGAGGRLSRISFLSNFSSSAHEPEEPDMSQLDAVAPVEGFAASSEMSSSSGYAVA